MAASSFTVSNIENLGDKKAVFGTLVITGAGAVTIPNFDNIDYVALGLQTVGTYVPRWTLSGSALTVVTATSASFYVMAIGR